MRRAVLPALIAALACACGSQVEPASAPLGDAGGDVDAALDADVEAGRDAAPIGAPFGPGGCASPCPERTPAAGEPCTAAGLECEYGGSFDARCNTVARCDSTRRWGVVPPSGACPDDLGGVTCPSSPFGPERGKPCPVEGAICPYVDGVCDCQRASAEAGTELVWACAVFTCKGPRARLGCSCSGTLSCQHGGCTGDLAHGIDVACRDGVWKRPDACR